MKHGQLNDDEARSFKYGPDNTRVRSGEPPSPNDKRTDNEWLKEKIKALSEEEWIEIQGIQGRRVGGLSRMANKIGSAINRTYEVYRSGESIIIRRTS